MGISLVVGLLSSLVGAILLWGPQGVVFGPHGVDGDGFGVGAVVAMVLFGGGIIVSVVGANIGVALRRAPGSVERGTPAEGVITGIKDTGASSNDDHQYKIGVRFTTEDGREVTAYDYLFLSALKLLQFQVGTPVALHYNPNNPSEMRIQRDSDAPSKGSPGVAYSPGPETPDYKGVPIRGRHDAHVPHDKGVILELTQSGPVVGGLRDTMLRVEVTRADGTKFEVTSTRKRPPAVLTVMGPGTKCYVHYPSGDEQHPEFDVKLGLFKRLAYGRAIAQSEKANPDIIRWEQQQAVSRGDNRMASYYQFLLDQALADSAETASASKPLAAPEPPRELFGPLTREDDDRLATGVPAQGVVMEATPTGNIVSGLGEMSLRVSVTRPDGSHFEVTTVRPVSPAALPICVPGHVINVYYHPDNEQQVTLTGVDTVLVRGGD